MVTTPAETDDRGPKQAVGASAGHVEGATDPTERARGISQVLQSAGFAALFDVVNSRRATDEALAAKTADQPLLRTKPTDLGNGASDAGGVAWVWAILATVALVAVIVALVR